MYGDATDKVQSKRMPPEWRLEEKDLNHKKC